VQHTQAVREEGSYANGRLHVELLPPEVYGPACEKRYSLRRMEAVLSEAEEAEHVQKELLRVGASAGGGGCCQAGSLQSAANAASVCLLLFPTCSWVRHPSCFSTQVASSLRVEPMRFATGQALEFTAGDAIPETAVAVVSGGGQRLCKAPFTGERLAVTQRLWRLPAGGGEGEPAPAGSGGGREEEAAEERPAKRRKGKKGRARQDENADPAAAPPAEVGEAAEPGSGMPPGAELLLTVENRTPVKDAFQFARITDGLQRAGSYALEYTAVPAVPGKPPLRLVVRLAVAPGPPCNFSLSGEGKAVAALKEVALGELRRRVAGGFCIDGRGSRAGCVLKVACSWPTAVHPACLPANVQARRCRR
jgi:hypothetical protein